METNEDGLSLIKHAEGLRTTAYQDSVGIWTIGYGHTGQDVTPDLSITEDDANQLLKLDLRHAENGVSKAAKVALNTNEFSALASFAFNLGVGTLNSSTLLKKLNADDRTGAADEFLRWIHAGGKELPGLIKRRQAERELFIKPMPA